MSTDRITYVGHATALIELDGVRVLTDPVLRPRLLTVIVRHSPEPDPEIAERIDAVLISHLHHDHLDFASLRRIGLEVRIVAPAGAGRVIRRRGFEQVIELGTGESTNVGGLEVRATAAIHDGRRHKVGPEGRRVGYLLRRRPLVYFAGDTDLFDGMEMIWPATSTWRCCRSPAGARRSARPPRPATRGGGGGDAAAAPAIPIHWGTLLRFDLGAAADELLHAPPRRFVAQLAERAPDVEAVVRARRVAGPLAARIRVG